MSEPIVKEELAIVEFLTAKNPSKAQVIAANGGSNGAARPEGSDENTPVDLLLGLAKTNSGRRAAEEEKRQLRLQQAREQEEQRQARRRVIQQGQAVNGQVTPSPWGYVPPQMPGLDVHQPFGASGPGPRRPQQLGGLPRPLQPPGTGKLADGSDIESKPLANTSWSPENPFGFTDRSSPGGFANANMLQPNFSGQNINLSPYQEMTMPLPGAGLSPSEQLALQGAGSAVEGGSGNGNVNQLSFSGRGQEFGSAVVDNFDFSAFGPPQSNMEMAFNPFAIQQTGDEG